MLKLQIKICLSLFALPFFISNVYGYDADNYYNNSNIYYNNSEQIFSNDQAGKSSVNMQVVPRISRNKGSKLIGNEHFYRRHMEVPVDVKLFTPYGDVYVPYNLDVSSPSGVSSSKSSVKIFKTP